MIVSGGENIYPGRSRERALFGHPCRRRRGRDRRARRASWGEAVKAIVVLQAWRRRGNCRSDHDRLHALAHRRLQAAEDGGLHRRLASQPDRQDPEAASCANRYWEGRQRNIN
jgi:acyl-CoA synthetase (AMP-forming)/AMP-acid ligase II